MPEVREVEIKELYMSDEFQMRDGLDSKLIDQLADAYWAEQHVTNITVAQVDDLLILVDGYHRVAALERLALGSFELLGRTIMADVHKTSRQGALLMAARANMTPGKPLKSQEKRKGLKVYIDNKGHHVGGRDKRGRRKPPKSFGTIAGELGLPKTTVIRWMYADCPREATAISNATVRDTGAWKYHQRPLLTDSDKAASKMRKRLEDARVAFQGVKSSPMRKELIKEAARLVQELKAMGAWKKEKPKPPKDDDSTPF